MLRRPILSAMLLAALPLSLAAPTAASAQQQSQRYKFLEAIRKGDGNAVIAMLDQPGQTIVNARDITTGEGAVHIVVKRGDATYLRYLLAKGADPNLRDGAGDTPMMLAVQAGNAELIQILANAKANANLGNGGGETPLIRAVQRRDMTLVRAVLAAGGNPDQTDNLAGMSARDYARRDARSPAIAKVLEETPTKTQRAVAGPRL